MRAVVQCIMANRLMALRFFVNCFKSAEATELVLRQRAQILDELADSVAKARHSATPAHGSATSVSALQTASPARAFPCLAFCL